jgi:hypothetical protein
MRRNYLCVNKIATVCAHDILVSDDSIQGCELT